MVNKELLEVDPKNSCWKPCLGCEGEIVEERRGFFVCLVCNKEYVPGDLKK